MSEAAKAEEAPEIEIPEGLTQADVDRGIRQGWAPKEDWKGDPEKWKDLNTFLEDGDKILPILKKNYSKLESELNALKAEREQDKKVFEKFQEFQSKSEERAYKKALKEIEDKMAEAVESGNKKAFADAKREEDTLRAEQQKQTETKDQPAEHPDWKPWKAENTWYTEDEELRELADALAPMVAQKNPNVGGKAFFELVKARVKQSAPHKFENPSRNKANAVEGEGGKPPKKGGKTYSDLPAEFKRACDEFVATIPGYTKEKYLKDVDWSQINE